MLEKNFKQIEENLALVRSASFTEPLELSKKDRRNSIVMNHAQKKINLEEEMQKRTFMRRTSILNSTQVL